MKQKTELKAALDALQVRKPLRLPSMAPAFTPPTPAVPPADGATLVPAETQAARATPVPALIQVHGATAVAEGTGVPAVSQVDVQTQVSLPTEVAAISAGNQAEPMTSVPAETGVAPESSVDRGTQASAQAPVSVPARVATSTGVFAPTPVPTRTGVGGGARERPEAEPRRAPEQDSAVALEAQASPKLQIGYTRIPNALLMRMVGGDLLRSEMRVALLIARLTISYQRRFSPISKAVIERQTGLRGPAVLHALAELVRKGMIEKIPGDQYRPNQFGLVGMDEWLPPLPNPPGSGSTPPTTSVPPETQVSRQTSVDGEICAGVPVRTSAPVARETPAWVAAGAPNKDRERYQNSLSSLPESLRAYFGDLKPARKRESEWEAFQDLRADYSVEDIADSLALLQARGIESTDSSRPCHSPMAFLSKAMGEILLRVQERRRKAEERADRESRKENADRGRRETEVREAEEWVMKERAFNRAFDGEERQREALTDLLRGMPFRAGTQTGRMIAIGRWWDSLNAYERQELTE